MTIFITAMSGSKSLSPSTYRFSHFRKSPGYSMAFDKTEKMEDLAAFSAREVKRVAAEERERDEYSSAEEQ